MHYLQKTLPPPPFLLSPIHVDSLPFWESGESRRANSVLSWESLKRVSPSLLQHIDSVAFMETFLFKARSFELFLGFFSSFQLPANQNKIRSTSDDFFFFPLPFQSLLAQLTRLFLSFFPPEVSDSVT